VVVSTNNNFDIKDDYVSTPVDVFSSQTGQFCRDILTILRLHNGHFFDVGVGADLNTLLKLYFDYLRPLCTYLKINNIIFLNILF
jgi:hypothetical protein